MKKEFVAFSIIMCGLISAPVFATNSSDYSCVAPYDLVSSGGAIFTKVSGTNFLASKVAAKVLKSQIKKVADGDFKVTVKSYSVPDLKEGRFKSLEIRGREVESEGIHFSTVDAKTLCDFNYVVYDGNKSTVMFKEDFPMSYSFTFSEDDLNETMKSKNYEKLISKMNKFGKKYSLFEILSTNVRVIENKFVYSFNLNLPIFNKQFTVALKSDLTVDNGRIVMKNAELVNNYAKIDLARLNRAFEELNPLEFSLELFENKYSDLSVRNVNIVNNKVNVSGIIYMPKDVILQHKD